jgi:hypothetical protein
MHSTMVRGGKTGRAYQAESEYKEISNVASTTGVNTAANKQYTKAPSSGSPQVPKKPITVAKWYTNDGKPDVSKPGPYNFTREIPLTENLYTKTPDGRAIRYTATSVICAKCEAAWKAKNGDSHNPACYGRQCARCNLYGHVGRNCLQA